MGGLSGLSEWINSVVLRTAFSESWITQVFANMTPSKGFSLY
jgi:hypothetical protein